MNERDKNIIRKVHRLFIEHLDPLHVMRFFRDKMILDDSVCRDFENIRFRGERTSRFLFIITESVQCTMETFIEGLNTNGYDFLVDILAQEYKPVPIQHKAEFCTRFKKELVSYRHYLKRLVHTGDHHTFEVEFYKAKANWSNLSTSCLQQRRYKAADKYFFALDGWCEYQRVIYNKDLMFSDVFEEIENLKPYLSEENLPEMMRLVRYGSAVLMTGTQKLDNALQYVNDAKSKFDLIHACRETGTVLYIEYNMLCQRYGLTADLDFKERLISIAHTAIDHFAIETESDEMVYLDFRRMVLLKLSHLYLGMGMFGTYLNVSVTERDKKIAEGLLHMVKDDRESWERMETRWKWSYYMAMGRFLGLKGSFDEAVVHLKKALRFAMHGKYSKEIGGSKTAIKVEKRNRKRNKHTLIFK